MKTLEQRFWGKVKWRLIGCWLWTAASSRGYGQFGVGGRLVYVHRVSWELDKGPIPEGMKVLHRCDNPLCVRPSHLFLGTQAENVADMFSKGRGVRAFGERSGRAKLTEFLVLKARRDSKTKTAASLARDLGVDESTIRDAIVGKTWKHIGEQHA